MNGARNDPAIAPQEIPINCAIKLTELVYCTSASTAEIAMNTTIKILMTKTCFASLIFFMKLSFNKSIVSVELDAITSDESVDIDADKTKITTNAIMPSVKPESIVGIIESNPFALMST